MKFLKTILLIFFLFLATKNAAADAFNDANAKYQAGDFKNALMQYENLAKSESNPAIYYNLANTYFRMNNKAKAVLNYERAVRLAPRDNDIVWNLDIARSVLTDETGGSDDALLLFWSKKIAAFLTQDEWAVLLTAGFLVLFILCLFQFLFVNAKAFLRFFQIVSFIYLILTGIFFTIHWSETKNPEVIVLEKEVYARFGPSKTETKAFMLHGGAKAKVLDQSRDWFYVEFAGKNSGWIPKASSEVI